MVIIMAGWVIATAIVVIPRYPELLAERVGPKKGAKTWDTALLSLYGVAMMIMWIVAGLDMRNNWSSGIEPMAQIGAMLIVIVFVIRTALEDRTLQAELPGYAEYAQHTRYRLVPGVW